MIKLKDNSKEQCEKLRDLFMTMKGRVPQARDVEAGADFLHSERSFDVCLTVTLESPEALEEYQKDPYLCNTVKTYVATVREKAVAVDYIVCLNIFNAALCGYCMELLFYTACI